MEEFIKNYSWIISLVIQGFIAYHVLVLSKRASKKEELENKSLLKIKIREIISEAYSSESNRKNIIAIDLNNIKRYPDGGCTAGDIKGINYDGIEIFLSNTKRIYKTKKNKLSLHAKGNEFYREVQLVGVIPFKWIESIEPHGDEYNSCAGKIFCHFKHFSPYLEYSFSSRNLITNRLKHLIGIKLWHFSPYNDIIYYTKNPTYKKGIDYYWEEYSHFCYEKELKSITLNG